jgi:hypothetical protein
MAKNSNILRDHVKKGSTFYPPFLLLDGMTHMNQVEWRKGILPEIFWLATIAQDHEFSRAQDLARGLATVTIGVNGNLGLPGIGTMSAFERISSSEWVQIRKRLRAIGLLEPLAKSFAPFVTLYPNAPIRFLFEGESSPFDKIAALDYMRPLLWDCLFRHEKLPTLIQGLYFDMCLASGKLHFAEGLKVHDTTKLADYPDSEESESTAAYLRCHANSICALGNSSDWPKYFWQTGDTLGPCDIPPDEGPQLPVYSQGFILYHLECFRFYNEETMAIWDDFQGHYSRDLYEPLRDEVLLGLACRIYRLTVQVVSFLPNWTEDIGQVFLRMAVESYIIWKWLREKGTEDDFKSFYEHGLGQQKLYMEHLNSYLEAQGLTPEEVAEMNPGLNFLKKHKMPDFIPVNVGNAWKKDLRKISEEAGVKALHSLIFGPTSSVVHGMYDSIDRYYLRQCFNPFHCLHRVPLFWVKNPISVYGAANTLQLMDWVFAEMCVDAGIDVPEPLPGEGYLNRLYDDDAFQGFCEREDVSDKAAQREAFVKKNRDRHKPD